MSAFPPKADIPRGGQNVRFVHQRLRKPPTMSARTSLLLLRRPGPCWLDGRAIRKSERHERNLSGQTKSGTAPRRRARWTVASRGDGTAHHRRGGLGKDKHARAPRRASDRRRDRPTTHHVANLLPTRGRRDAEAGRTHHIRGARTECACARRRHDWSGTFHAIGARLLREYASEIGLNREFTIHDRRIPRI